MYNSQVISWNNVTIIISKNKCKRFSSPCLWLVVENNPFQANGRGMKHTVSECPLKLAGMAPRASQHHSGPRIKQSLQPLSSCIALKMPRKYEMKNPRPTVHVKPRENGPVKEYGTNDVLSGRGRNISEHMVRLFRPLNIHYYADTHSLFSLGKCVLS